MPDIGLFELLLIGAVAFLVLGPERMPEFFAQIGRLVRRARRWGEDIKHQIDVETRDIRQPADEVRDALSVQPMTADEGVSKAEQKDRE